MKHQFVVIFFTSGFSFFQYYKFQDIQEEDFSFSFLVLFIFIDDVDETMVHIVYLISYNVQCFFLSIEVNDKKKNK